MQVVGPGHLVSGRYRLLAQIAGGGMGTVWRARDELLGRQVAVKQIVPPAGADDEQVDQQRQRALREGRIAARLSHPHAISVYDVAMAGGSPWLVMEYLPSRSLAQVLAEDGPLRPAPVAQIGAQVADALVATHAAGIVHRDVKPANVLVGQGGDVEGLVKITDFGISHATGDVTLTQTGQLTGTPAFLAPEVAQGAEMSEASDVFSLGATLYTCLEGEPPFGVDDNALRLLHRVAGGGVRAPTRAGILAAPLMAMLADDPASRPAMEEVRDRLAQLAVGRDGDPTTVLLARTDLRSAADRSPTPVPAPPPAGGRRRRWPLLVAGLVVLLLAGVGVAWLTADRDDGGSGAAPAPPATSADAPPSSEDPAPGPATTAEPPGTSAGEPATSSGHASSDPPQADPAAEVQETLETYYALLPGDPGSAYELTGPTLRSEVGFGSYSGFWATWAEANLLDVRDVSVDGDRITATTDVEFLRPGERQVETHAVTFVRADGRLLIDLDVVA